MIDAYAGFAITYTYLQPAPLPISAERGAWSALTAYQVGNLVTYSGNWWQAQTNPTVGVAPTTPQWAQITPVDVTGYTAKMDIRGPGFSGAVALSLAGGSGITVGTTNGEFAVAITGAQAGTLAPEGVPLPRLVYDLLVTPPSGQPVRLAQGNVGVSPTATY